MNKKKKYTVLAVLFGIISVAFTLTVLFVDRKATDLENTYIGLFHINNAVFKFFGVNMIFYDITDWLGIFGILVAVCFAVTGFIQLIKRKSLFRVDKCIIVLGVFYLIVIAFYVFFEKVIVNYRPIIMPNAKKPEASFPSSHTFITCTILWTAIFAIDNLIKNKKIKTVIKLVFNLVAHFTVIGRLISGVHWLTDIIAGMLYSLTLTFLYSAIIKKTEI